MVYFEAFGKRMKMKVLAEDEQSAKEKVLRSYDVYLPADAVTWRFVEERPDDWSPFGDRFPKADWMQWS